MFRKLLISSAIILGLCQPLLAAEAPVGQSVEVCFVLDSTGSMGGLIEGAKTKIWVIANEIIASKPKPKSIKLGLIAYRDKGDKYVTSVFDLTDDIDMVSKNLHGFSADGGGDEPESVNQALDEAVEKIAWSKDKNTLKVIFLVGDAPPHMDYKDDVKYPEICKKAVAKDIIINTVQCGSIVSTTPVWQEIAKLSEGSFVQLGQTGDMVAIATPMDAELAELNKKVGHTLVSYGVGGERWTAGHSGALFSKQAASEAAPASVAADRLKFNASSGKAVQGEGELIDALNAKTVKLEDLKDEQLPEDLRKLTPEQRKARIEELTAERKELQTKIDELTNKRDAYIIDEKKKLAAAGKKEAFDEEVSKVITEQAARRR